MIDQTLLRFLLVGIGNTLIGLCVIFGARQFVSDVAANLVGYLIVVPISFFMHRDLSFKDQGRRLSAFMRYIPTVTVGYTANYLVLTGSLEAGVNPYLAQTFAIGCHVAVTYLLSRLYVFILPDENPQ